MAVSLTNMPVYSFKCSSKPGIFTDNSTTGKLVRVDKPTQGSNTAKFQLLEVKMRYCGENCQIASHVVEHSYCSLSTPPEDIVELAKHSKAAESEPKAKLTSLVCAKCEGNGAIACTQCKGSGVNSVDHFDGQFKAGGLCWLCRGKRDILCGECNGAGFIGGFMSTFDE